MRSLLTNRTGLLACAAFAFLLPSCQDGGHFTLFGYTTQPNFRCDIHTVRVKVFANKTYRQGLEFMMTQALIREIEAKTPWKVVNDGPADTEVSGSVMSFTKGVTVVNNVNEGRDWQTTMTVQFTWRDLRTGEILSKPPRRPGDVPEVPTGPPIPVGPPPLGSVPGVATNVIQPPTGPITPFTVTDKNSIVVTTTADMVPELGQSLSSAEQVNINKMAREIVNLMEKPW